MSSLLPMVGLLLWSSLPPGATPTLPARSGRPAWLRVSPPEQTSRLWTHPDEPGAWLPWWNSCTAVNASVRAQWEAQLKAIAALVRACPVFEGMRGYYPELIGCVQPPGGVSAGPYDGDVALLIWPPETVERTAKGELQVKPSWRFNHPGDNGGSLWIRVNATGDLRDWVAGDDKEGRFYELPETRREIAGFPVVGGFLFVTGPNRPPIFAPITRERAQRWIIDNLKRQAGADASILASAQRQYDEFISPEGKTRRAKAVEEAAASQTRPENQELARRQALARDQRREQDLKAAATPKPGSPEAKTRERLAQLESRLAAMSAEERLQPAWYKRHAEGVRRLDYGDIVEAGTAGARPLVVPNPDFFDKSLPKTAMQLVSVPAAGHYDSLRAKSATDVGIRVPLAVIEQMDWRAVAAMLK